MTDLEAEKAAARKAALARRAQAHASDRGGAAERLRRVLADAGTGTLAGYLAMRSEIDPGPAMAEAAAHRSVCVPVIEGAGQELSFKRWVPGCALQEGPFGTMVPEAGEVIVPELLIVPLVAFDRKGGRLGYGGGYYDRTLQELRARGPVRAIGFAYAAQEADSLPLECTDQPLDMIVTEAEVIDVG